MAEPTFKICTKCNQRLPLEAYKCSKKGKHGKDSACCECRKSYMREYRQRPEVKAHNKSYFADRYKNPEYRNAQKINAQKPERKARKAGYQGKYRAANKKTIAQYMAEYCKDERVQTLRSEACKRYEKKNKERRLLIQAEKRKHPKRKIRDCMSGRISKALKRKKAGKSWNKLVDYTLEELMNHLEKQFKPGMAWNNKNKWHIDHKKPISSFNFTSPNDEEFKKCWALKNLQPLWAEENLRKGAKMEVHH